MFKKRERGVITEENSDAFVIFGLGVAALAAASFFIVQDLSSNKHGHEIEKKYIEQDGFEVQSMPDSFSEVLGDVETENQVATILSFGTCAVKLVAAKSYGPEGRDMIGVQDYPFVDTAGNRYVVQNRAQFDALPIGDAPCDNLTNLVPRK